MVLPSIAGHADRLTSEPAAGARLEVAPTEILVTLSEPIEPSSAHIEVTRSDGLRVDVGRTTVMGSAANPVLRVALIANLSDGAYLVTHTVLSGDTHLRTQTFGFAIGPYDPPAASAPEPVDLFAALARFAVFAGIAFTLGACVFLTWLRPTPAAPALPMLAMGTFLHASGVAALLLHTAQEGGFASPALYLATSTGGLFAWRFILGAAALVLALLAMSPNNPSRLAAPLAGILVAAAAIPAAMLSHSFAHGVGAIAVDALHLLAAATWVGGLAVLLLWLSRAAPDPVEALRVGRRFGSLALGCVIILAATGFTTALILVGAHNLLNPTVLLAGPWGRFLALKLVLLAVMVAAAAVNRFVFLDAPRTSGLAGFLQRFVGRAGWGSLAERGNVPTFRRIVRVEVTLGLVVLLVAGLLTAVAPPTADPVAGSAVILATGTDHDVILVLHPTPRVGTSSMASFTIKPHDGGPPLANNTCGRTTGSCITMTVFVPAAEAGEVRQAMPDGIGGWMVHDILWTTAGAARLEVLIQSAQVFEDVVSMQVAVAFDDQ